MSNNSITVTISNQPLMDKITQLQQEIITLEETVTSLNAQIADLNQQAEQKQATIDSLNTQISQLQEQISQLDAQVTALTEQVQTLILENSQLTQQVESLTTENTQLTQQVESLTTENSQLTEQAQSLTSQVSQLAEQVQQLQASVESLNGQITSMTNQINTINGETVENPVEYLSGTKSQILQALQSKGSSATASTAFREYANIINNFNVLPDGDEHTTLLLHLDSDNQLKDSSIYQRPVATYSSGDTVPFIDTSANGKFGNKALKVDGTNCIYINQTDFFPFSAPGWTIEFFYYPNSWVYNSYYCFVSNYHSFTINGTSYTRYQRFSRGYNYSTECPKVDYYRPQSSAVVNEIAYGASMSNNAWHHFAIVRNSLDTAYKLRIYVDGAGVSWRGSNPNIGGDYFTPLDSLPVPLYFFGMARNNTTPNNFCPCWVNEIRVSDVCRYTANFTPPTEPFTI